MTLSINMAVRGDHILKEQFKFYDHENIEKLSYFSECGLYMLQHPK